MHQLLGGLFDQKKQGNILDIHIACLNQRPARIGEKTDTSDYDEYPTTRQGDVLESRMNAMELRIIGLEKENAEKTQKIAALDTENFELKEVIREIGARLFNQDTQKGAWRELREMFYHDGTFDDMDEELREEWSTTTSIWGDSFTTRQGDANEERLARIEEKMKEISKAFN
jgi:hypothetical protein